MKCDYYCSLSLSWSHSSAWFELTDPDGKFKGVWMSALKPHDKHNCRTRHKPSISIFILLHITNIDKKIKWTATQNGLPLLENPEK